MEDRMKHIDRLSDAAKDVSDAMALQDRAVGRIMSELEELRDQVHGQRSLPGLSEESDALDVLAAKDAEIAELQETLQDTAEQLRVLRADLIAGTSTTDRAPIIATIDVMIRALQ